MFGSRGLYSVRCRPPIRKLNPRPRARPARELKIASNFLHTLPHISQAIARTVVRHVFETSAVVLNNNRDLVLGGRDPETNLRGPGVARDVIQGFLDHQEQIVASFGSDM